MEDQLLPSIENSSKLVPDLLLGLLARVGAADSCHGPGTALVVVMPEVKLTSVINRCDRREASLDKLLLRHRYIAG